MKKGLKTGLNHKEVRTEEQRKLMMQIERDGVCPFCKENFTKYHPKPILKETNYWFVTENISPYEGTTTHLLFVYKPKHISSPEDMTDGSFDDLRKCIGWAKKEFNITGGSFFMRLGDTNYNGSSVEHLHAQLITGVSGSEGTKPMKIKLGWKKE